MSKYIIKDNLEKFEWKIQYIKNQNIKMDYDKILKIAKKEFEEMEKTDKSKLHIFNYVIEKHIYKVNQIK